jgi:hypothetical protein
MDYQTFVALRAAVLKDRLAIYSPIDLSLKATRDHVDEFG